MEYLQNQISEKLVSNSDGNIKDIKDTSLL